MRMNRYAGRFPFASLNKKNKLDIFCNSKKMWGKKIEISNCFSKFATEDNQVA